MKSFNPNTSLEQGPRSGFTLMELLVALTAAAILVTNVFGMYYAYHRSYFKLLSSYRESSKGQIIQMGDKIKNVRSSSGHLF